MEQIAYNMMFRWFAGLSMDAPFWDVMVFTKNRDRMLESRIVRSFPTVILVDPKVKPLLSDEYFSLDGTLIEPRASMKSFKPKDGSGRTASTWARRRGGCPRQAAKQRTHASMTDPDARLYKRAAG
jgi:hypothetical protein